MSGLVLHFLAFRSSCAVGTNFENLVQPETGKKLPASLTTMDHAKMSLAKLFQSQCHCGHCSHESGIHHRAMFEIENELAVTAVYHLLRELFQVPAVQEVALAFHSHPNGGAVHAD